MQLAISWFLFHVTKQTSKQTTKQNKQKTAKLSATTNENVLVHCLLFLCFQA